MHRLNRASTLFACVIGAIACPVPATAQTLSGAVSSAEEGAMEGVVDRKSTRLNSSH